MSMSALLYKDESSEAPIAAVVVTTNTVRNMMSAATAVYQCKASEIRESSLNEK